MKNVLNKIKSKYCSICEVGSPSAFLGYKSSGTCLDYIYDTFKVPYSLAWEIYTNEKLLPEMEKYKDLNFEYQNGPVNLESSFLSEDDLDEIVDYDESSFIEKSSTRKLYTVRQNDKCLALFNPLIKSEFKYIIENWKKALVLLFNYVKEN